MVGTNDDSGIEECGEDIGEKWIADSGASFISLIQLTV